MVRHTLKILSKGLTSFKRVNKLFLLTVHINKNKNYNVNVISGGTYLFKVNNGKKSVQS